jgi:hypothetical protein
MLKTIYAGMWDISAADQRLQTLWKSRISNNQRTRRNERSSQQTNGHVISSDKRESMNSFPCKNDLHLLLLRRENHRGTVGLVI